MNKDDQIFFTNDNISKDKIPENINTENMDISEEDNSIRKASLIYYLLS